MELEVFYEKISPFLINLDEEEIKQHKYLLSNEVLFQLPFLSMVILLLAKERSKPKVPEIANLVGQCLEKTMPAFKKSKQFISWSANLRIRTVKAMSILEIHQLIEIDNTVSRIKITDKGKKVIDKALKSDDSLSYHLTKIQQNYQSIRRIQQYELEV